MKKLAALFILTVSLSISSCIDDTPSLNELLLSFQNLTSTTVIDSSGGQIIHNNGLLTMDIPAGALSEETEISISRRNISDLPAPDNSVTLIGDAFDFKPDGLQFQKDVSATFMISDIVISNLSSDDILCVHYLNEESQKWEKLPSEVTLKTNQIKTALKHFSIYAVGFSTVPFQMPLGDMGIPKDYESKVADFSGQSVHNNIIGNVTVLPARFNWKEHGMVTPAELQSGKTCWAYAATGVLESKILIAGGPELDLSEHQQIFSNTSQGGCNNGGNSHSLLFWSDRGPILESNTAYEPCEETFDEFGNIKEYKCAASSDDINNYSQLEYHIKDFYYVSGNDIDGMKKSLLKDGPGYFRYVVYEDFDNFWNFAKHDEVYTHLYGKDRGGHAVLIIGWDDRKQAWLCKNSWGRYSGPNNDGTFWIAYSGHRQNLGFFMANAGMTPFNDQVAENFSAVYAPQRDHTEVFAMGPDGYLHYFYNIENNWIHDNSSFISAGRVAGNISAVFAPQRNHSEVFFRGVDGYLKYSFVENSRWIHDSASFTGAGRVAGDISAVFAPQRNHSEVFFKGEDGYMHYFFVQNGRWVHDSTTFTGAGRVAGDISAVFAPQRNHSEVFFRGEDGYLHYFFVQNGRWVHDSTTFTGAGRVAGDISAVFAPQRNHSEVFFRGEDGYLHYFFVQNGSWVHDSVSFSGAGRVAGDISTVFAPQRNHSEVFFKGENGCMHYFYVENDRWNHDSASFTSAGVLAGEISALFSTQRNHSEVFFRGKDGRLHFMFVEDNHWFFQ